MQAQARLRLQRQQPGARVWACQGAPCSSMVGPLAPSVSVCVPFGPPLCARAQSPAPRAPSTAVSKRRTPILHDELPLPSTTRGVSPPPRREPFCLHGEGGTQPCVCVPLPATTMSRGGTDLHASTKYPAEIYTIIALLLFMFFQIARCARAPPTCTRPICHGPSMTPPRPCSCNLHFIRLH